VVTGAAAKLRAGEYAFAPGTKPLDVIALLKKGKVLYRAVTIPEGTELAKIAGLLAADGWVDLQHFLDLAREPQLLAELGVAADSLEGHLFPDTYYLSRDQQDAADIIRMMVDNHFKVFNDLTGKTGSYPLELTHHGIVTLASIVEKETGNPEERGLVAVVFLNRLAQGMRLQADPTVRYSKQENMGLLNKKFVLLSFYLA
jgi:UPF0755 protein